MREFLPRFEWYDFPHLRRPSKFCVLPCCIGRGHRHQATTSRKWWVSLAFLKVLSVDWLSGKITPEKPIFFMVENHGFRLKLSLKPIYWSQVWRRYHLPEKPVDWIYNKSCFLNLLKPIDHHIGDLSCLDPVGQVWWVWANQMMYHWSCWAHFPMENSPPKF